MISQGKDLSGWTSDGLYHTPGQTETSKAIRAFPQLSSCKTRKQSYEHSQQPIPR